MDAVRLARRKRLGGAQPALQIEGECGRRQRRDFWNTGHRRTPRKQDHAGLSSLTFEDRKHRICGWGVRNCDADVKTLGDGDWKALSRNRMDPEPVNCDELAAESAKIEVIRAH